MGCDIYYSTCLKVTREEKIRDASKMDTLNGKERSDKNRYEENCCCNLFVFDATFEH